MVRHTFVQVIRYLWMLCDDSGGLRMGKVADKRPIPQLNILQTDTVGRGLLIYLSFDSNLFCCWLLLCLTKNYMYYMCIYSMYNRSNTLANVPVEMENLVNQNFVTTMYSIWTLPTTFDFFCQTGSTCIVRYYPCQHVQPWASADEKMNCTFLSLPYPWRRTWSKRSSRHCKWMFLLVTW